jgi:TRAP-type mannitol/chloroaromatic compound transport system permease small subunit
MLETVSNTLSTDNQKRGRMTSFSSTPCCFIVVYEVFMRYVFNAPTTWGFEATTFLYGLHYMFGLAYTDVHDGHVKVDILHLHVSEQVQAILD